VHYPVLAAAFHTIGLRFILTARWEFRRSADLMKTSMKFTFVPRSASGILIAITLVCFAFLPKMQAVSPPPDGGYAGGNTAEGQSALLSLTTGTFNTAIGFFSGLSLTDGSFNTGTGAGTLLVNSAAENTAVGAAALLNNTTGASNTAIGFAAGINQISGSNNIYIGDAADPTDTNVIAIGNISSSGTAYDSFFVGGVFGASVNSATATAVFVDDSGKLGTMLVGANGNRMTVPRAQGAQPQAMLNELHKEQKRIAELESMVARLAATVKEQAAQIQKVSAQLELNKPAPQTVANK
jgi:hypothetical protein